ncbi:MAG: ArsR/SmtB family transcription factor [Kofleriaceae bacterium]
MSRSALAASAIKDAAPLFAALGDATRLQVLARLCAEGPESIAGLSEHAHVTRQAITKHLEVLEEAGLVTGTRKGRERVWTFVPERFDDAKSYLDRISAQWDNALARLAKLVEEN